MAEAAFSFAVQKLGQLAIQKVGFLQGVEAQVNWLKDELETMQCFLKDAAEKQADNQSIRKWISDIRELAQDADDVIETFILKIDAPRRSRGLIGRFAYLPRHVYHLDRVGEEIERIRSKLEALAKSRDRYGIEEISEEKSEDAEYRRRFSPWQKDKQVVGMEEDVEILLRRSILEERERLSVAGIVGMGGIGKSTLARVVYNHAAVAGRFERRAWICVSSEFKEREIIKELVMQLVGPTEDKLNIVETMEKLEVPSLREMLHKRLQGTRYFVVVDDVWEEEHWECLATVFPCEDDQASRLLLTSRNRDITKYARYVHEMKILDPNKSWQLFVNKAFIEDTNGKCPQDLENIGRKILKKCNGLPLAITVVGGLLAKQGQSEIEWAKVLKGMNSHLGRGKNSVSSILELSYHNLPPKLKSCFLCLAFFKEDATIRVEKLVHVWIAQGLVPQEEEEEETVEEIARSYLDELINRNMVQVKEMSIDDRVKSCYVHDLLREVSIAKAKEEISFEILRDENSQSLDKPRHRVVHCSAERRFIYSTSSNKRLRSLFFHGSNIACGSSYWKSFELLRVLDFEDFGLNKLPDEIGSLVGLRYLGLRNNRIRKLPSSLGLLRNLEVLDIAKNCFVKVPSFIWHMENLRHVYILLAIFDAPPKINTLKNLQTLNYILIYRMPEDPTQMTSLRKLGVELDINTDVTKLCTSLAMLENLVCLNLRWFGFKRTVPIDGLGILHRLTQLKLHGELTMLPSASDFPPNLSYLSLVRTRLDEDPMPVLEKLPKLLYLKLNDAYVGSKMVISNDGFPRLKVLCLRWMLHLRNMKVGKGGISQLKRLEIHECQDLYLPEELRFMTNVRE